MRTTALIIGAGHAGLAMSRCLAERSIDHLVVERGAIANSWKTERWDSLRLLTPNWQSRLPGLPMRATDVVDRDGFRSMPETVALIEHYARIIAAPVRTGVHVTRVHTYGGGYRAETDAGPITTRCVVLATGACARPNIPASAAGIPPGIRTLSTAAYRNPDQLEPGGVLVVGASASGIQIADELQRSGRPVTLAVGEHIRAPRTYRGRDVQWWLDGSGIQDERIEAQDDPERARGVPSLQLAGTPDGRMLDLNALTAIGVRLVGRLVGVRDGVAQFSGSLRNCAAMSDLKMNRLLDRLDAWAETNGFGEMLGPPERYPATHIERAPALQLDLGCGAIRTVIWATGYRPDHRCIDLPVFDRSGRIRHTGGIVDAPGLYLMGMPFMRRRKSTLIDGAGPDARELAAHLHALLDRQSRDRIRPARAAAPHSGFPTFPF
ncbi:MAG: NAD(P)-binding domain-containing protein [Pseudomonadales bacterium]|nr:NAD(P)-binding domain-containing protein [Pseudomonadales bacterium]